MRDLLESLRTQTRPPDEVVICDGGSTDRTVKAIEDFPGCGVQIRVVRSGPAFPGRARNLAIRAAGCELIALTDAGVRLDRRWLEHLMAPFQAPTSPEVVYGNFEPMKRSFWQRCIGIAFVPPRDPHSRLRGPTVASMAMHYKVWEYLGGFREDLRSAEDLLFIKGIARGGFLVRYAPDALVFWDPPRDFRAAFRRFSMYSYSNIRAGLAQSWQVPVLRTYVLMGVLTSIAWWTPLGFLAPLALLAVRAMKRVVREMGVPSLCNIPVLIGVMVALVTIDCATLDGCRRWLTTDWNFRVRQARSLAGRDRTEA